MKTAAAIKQVPVSRIRPSPENDELYKPVDPNDPDTIKLVRSIAVEGVKEPLVITLDWYILSGHRRYAASRMAGLTEVPCRTEPIRRMDSLNEFARRLAIYNQQRVKSFDEVMREEAIQVNPHEAYQSLIEYRKQKSDLSDCYAGDHLKLGAFKRRKGISAVKQPMLEAIRRVVEARRKFWPLSDRGIHYGLLNKPPLRNSRRPGSTYANDRRSYQDLTDLLTRARLIGEIPWEAIADETRPFTPWGTYRHPGDFLRNQMNGMLKGYWRDLMQSQPNHIEIVAEKLTVQKVINDVAAKYCIPTTIGRGFCSIDPRRRMAQRFARSGKQTLVLLLVSDFDPDGQEIAKSFARSMRDDFGIDNIEPVKVALTADQVEDYGLPPNMLAKKSSSNHAKFVKEHGHHAYELEALNPTDLQSILTDAIDQAIDTDAFNAELEAEERDAANIEAARLTIHKMLKDVRLDGDVA